jgi:hypothetical protein
MSNILGDPSLASPLIDRGSNSLISGSGGGNLNNGLTLNGNGMISSPQSLQMVPTSSSQLQQNSPMNLNMNMNMALGGLNMNMNLNGTNIRLF